MNDHEYLEIKARRAVAKAEYIEINTAYQAERHARAQAKRIAARVARADKEDAKAAKARLADNGQNPIRQY